MFKFLNTKEQLRLEQQKNAQLQEQVQELTEALIEVAEIAAENAEVING